MELDEHPLFVTRSIAPDMEKLKTLMDEIVKSSCYTNFGPMENEFRKTLTQRWGLDYTCLFNNATTALIAGLYALPKRGTYLTTPFTFAATSHAIIIAGSKVKFCDIDENTLNIDPELIENLIDDDTIGVVGTHVYGNPCDVDSIHEICKMYSLYEVYDAAHCVDVSYKGVSLYKYGLFSVASFHATKLLHCCEGGALFTSSRNLAQRIKIFMNFGIENEERISCVGLNGKMSEINAAVGLSVIDSVSNEIEHRKKITEMYHQALDKIRGVKFITFPQECTRNYQYFPILLFGDSPARRDAVFSLLKEQSIHCRKYFSPLLSNIDPYKEICDPATLPVANKVSKQILCLPLSNAVEEKHIEIIQKTIMKLS